MSSISPEPSPRRILIVAGEASGDLHGSSLVRALRTIAPGVEVSGIGGDLMQREGMRLVHHCADLAFMGFVEVVRNLATIRHVEKKLLGELEERTPDVVVLIDYPGFNLRFARKVKARHIPVLYYISPQVWAWNKGRVRKMRQLVDRMKVVFPFEVELYRAEGIDVEFVGHPLVEGLGVSLSREEFFRESGLDPSRRLLGLFPGSRIQEIERILPVMARAAESLQRTHDVQIALGVAAHLGEERLRRYLPPDGHIGCLQNRTYELMAHADAAIVTSGTATLETGWFGTPMVVVYRTSPLTFFIGRLLVDVPYIGLVNIVAGKKIVPEFIQHHMTAENLTGAVSTILDNTADASSMRADLAVVRQKLGQPGASARVARAALELAGRP